MRLLHISLTSRPVVLQVGGITSLRAILRGKGVKKTKGMIGEETIQRGRK